MTDSSRSTLSKTLRAVGWPIRKLLLVLVAGYRKWISPALPDSCKYHPSCSSYAVQAIEEHGAGKGVLLASARLARCNPFSEGGVNPIPERGYWRASINTDGTPRGITDTHAAAVGGLSQTVGDGAPPGRPDPGHAAEFSAAGNPASVEPRLSGSHSSPNVTRKVANSAPDRRPDSAAGQTESVKFLAPGV